MDPEPSVLIDQDGRERVEIYNLYRDGMIVDGVLMKQRIVLGKNIPGENFLAFERTIGDRTGMIRLSCAEGDLDNIDYNKLEAMMDDQMSENFIKEWEEKWTKPKPNPRQMRLSPEFLARFFREEKPVSMNCCNIL